MSKHSHISANLDNALRSRATSPDVFMSTIHVYRLFLVKTSLSQRDIKSEIKDDFEVRCRIRNSLNLYKHRNNLCHSRAFAAE